MAVLVALGGTVTLTALAAARRTSTSVGRALEAANVADVSVDVGVIDRTQLAELAQRPEVRQLSTYLFVAVRPGGTDLVGGIQVVGVAPLDDKAVATMDAPRYRAGRPPRPDAVDEVAINSTTADHLHLGVGDVMTVEAYTQEQVGEIFESSDPPAPTGAHFRARVTGIADPLDSFAAHGGPGGFGIIQLSPAAWAAHGAPLPLDYTGDPPASAIGAFRLVLRAQLRHGAADAPRFLRDVFRTYGDAADTTFSESRPTVFRAASDSVRVQTIALLLFGLAAALATLVAAGQAAARGAALTASPEDEQLRAMGARRRDRIVAATVPGAIGALVGAVLALIGALVASQWMPRGLAGRFEPDPGVDFDAAVLVPCAIALVLVVAARAAAAAWRATSVRPHASERPRRLFAALPPAPSLGARLAVNTPTLVAAVVAVAGTVGAFTFAGSLDHLGRTPRLAGEPWDTQILVQSEGAELAAREAPRLAEDDRVSALSRYGLFEVGFGSPARVSGFAIERLKGEVAPTVLSGRLPNALDEIAVDPASVPGAGPRIGQRITVESGGKSTRMTVVGTLTGTGEGFVVTAAAAERLEAEIGDAGFLLRWRKGVDQRAAVADLKQRFAEVEGPDTPDRVTNVRDARAFPYALGVFLALLGLLAAGHLLVTTVRRRRHDLAIVRALGLTPGQVRSVAAWQATTVAVIGVVLGVPAGLAIGRWSWAAVTNALRVVDETPTPVVSIVVIVLATLALANLLAAVPGHRAARIHPADALRTE
jgi:hypothetical protein